MKIIQIVENLDKGAVENWLVNVFIESRKIKPDWEWTFYCILGKEGRLDSRVKEAGGKIIYSPVTLSKKLRFLYALRKTLKAGRYDVLHAHHDYLSGFYLLASIGMKFKKRLLHVHNTDKLLPVGNRVLHDVLLKPFRFSAIQNSNMVVGISQEVLKEFAGKKKAGQSGVLYYGIDVSRFEAEADCHQIKKELQLPANSKVLLFVGRMTTLKNPLMVVQVLNEVRRFRDDVYAVFIGQGELEETIRQRALSDNVSEFIRMAGWRNDISAMMQCADIFLFPRIEYPKEGLGLVVVEAQAAGLPMMLSNGIVKDAIEVQELAHFLPLNVQLWTKKVLEILDSQPSISKMAALDKIKRSKFQLHTATQNLLKLYHSADQNTNGI